MLNVFREMKPIQLIALLTFGMVTANVLTAVMKSRPSTYVSP